MNYVTYWEVDMMPKNKNTPSVRFAGFTDAWEQRKLGEVGKVQSGIGFPDREQGGTYGTPFYKVSDMNTVGNEHEMTIANNYVTEEQISRYKWKPILELPAIFFAKVGAAVLLNRKRLVRNPFLMDNNTMSYSLSKKTWDTLFAKTLFETLDLTSLTQVGALPSYNASDVEEMEITLPSLREQERIGAFFGGVDSLITLHRRKYEKLVNIKKSMLDTMFPKNDALVPEVRFAGFTDAWERSRLGELCDVFRSGEFIKASDISVEGEFPVYGGNGLRGFADRFNYEGNYALIGRQGALCGNMNYSTGKAYFTEHAVAVQANDNNSTRFLFYLLDTMNLGQYSAQSAQPGLAVNKLITLPTMCPTKDEQESIAVFLTLIDTLITLHQRKIKRLQNIKKACLEKMFI